MARSYAQHGLTPLKAALRVHGMRAVDGRSALGRAMKAWRLEHDAHLGSRATPPLVAILDTAEVTKALLVSVDTWLLKDPSHVWNRKRREFTQAAMQRLKWADSLRKDMLALGLEVAAPVVPALEAYLAARYGTKKRKPRPKKPRTVATNGEAYEIPTTAPAATPAAGVHEEPSAEAIALHDAEDAPARGDSPTPDGAGHA